MFLIVEISINIIYKKPFVTCIVRYVRYGVFVAFVTFVTYHFGSTHAYAKTVNIDYLRRIIFGRID